MNKILIRYVLITYIFFSLILKKSYVFNTHIYKKLNNSQLSTVESILIGQGLKMPVTSSWQLLLILLSKNQYGLSIIQEIGEFFESKDLIEEHLAKSFQFYLHPAMNISSSVLIHPRSEFLEFVFTFIDTAVFMGNSSFTSISLLINEKRNLVACNSMIRKMIKDGFILKSLDCEITPQNQHITVKNSGIITQNCLEYSTNQFCRVYLINLVELFDKLSKIKTNSINNLYQKKLLYNKICQLLDSK